MAINPKMLNALATALKVAGPLTAPPSPPASLDNAVLQRPAALRRRSIISGIPLHAKGASGGIGTVKL